MAFEKQNKSKFLASAIKPITGLLSGVYGTVVTQKAQLYEKQILKTVRLKKPVISVGNLSVGGTGKTPVVESILRLCLQKQLKVCVIARNYKAQSSVAAKVDLKREQAALYYGDEPTQIAQKFPSVTVWTGPNKAQTALQAEQDDDYDLFIIDDGFQHLALHRDFDVVLIDATSSQDEDQLLPAGRLREDFAALSRADVVLLTKCNWAEPSRAEQLGNKLEQIVLNLKPQTLDANNSVTNQQGAVSKVLQLARVEFEQKALFSLQAKQKFILLCGIAKPQVFFAQAQSFLTKAGAIVCDQLAFADHCVYAENELAMIRQQIDRHGAETLILTTEKDFTKLHEIKDLRDRLNCLSVSAKLPQEATKLYEFIDSIAR